MNIHIKPKIASFAFVALIATLSGCSAIGELSADSVEPDRSARVKLDYDSSLITFPIENYQISDADWSLVTEAREIIFNQCMVKIGFTAQPNPSALPFEDRNFGIWNVERAQQNGFSIPGLDTTESQDSKPEGWGDARDKCVQQESGRLQEISPPDPAMNPSIADKISQQSLVLATKDPAWKQAREEWWTCLRDQGLEPRTGDLDWSSEQALELAMRAGNETANSSTAEEGIRIATIEAECNQKTLMTQRLGDIQASYQMPLISKQQSALNEGKAENEKYVLAAKTFIQNNQ